MIDWNCPNCNYKNFGHRHSVENVNIFMLINL